jgi:hypothetical protein
MKLHFTMLVAILITLASNAKAYGCAEENNAVCEAKCNEDCNRVCDEIYKVNPLSLPGHCPYRRPNTYVQLLLFITGRCLGCSSGQNLFDQVSGLVGEDGYSGKEEKKTGWEMAAEDAVKTGGLKQLERNLKDAAEAGYEPKDSEYEEMARVIRRECGAECDGLFDQETSEMTSEDGYSSLHSNDPRVHRPRSGVITGTGGNHRHHRHHRHHRRQ